MPARKKRLPLLIGLAAIPVAGVALAVLLWPHRPAAPAPPSFAAQPFEPLRWASTPPTQRGPMAQDLVDRSQALLIGRTPQEVEALLGRAHEPGRYPLGQAKDNVADTVHLVVEFGADGRVSRVSLAN